MDRVTKCWCGGNAYTEISLNKKVCAASKFHDPMSDGRPKEIRKIYIAGPMSGLPECNYPAFHKAEAFLKDLGFEVVNPAHSEVEDGHYVDFLREDLRWMLDCDAVAILPGWWDSVGARNEVNVAGLLRMPVRTAAEWSRYAKGLS